MFTVEFSHHCDFCECFVKYENRDLKLPNLPYLEIVYPTEDECLAFCFQDRRCKHKMNQIFRFYKMNQIFIRFYVELCLFF